MRILRPAFCSPTPILKPPGAAALLESKAGAKEVSAGAAPKVKELVAGVGAAPKLNELVAVAGVAAPNEKSVEGAPNEGVVVPNAGAAEPNAGVVEPNAGVAVDPKVNPDDDDVVGVVGVVAPKLKSLVAG